MSNTVRFIHSADLHLGSPLKTLETMSKTLRQTLQEASFQAVKKLVDSALDLEVDFLLLSGDIYDRDARSVKANEFLAGQIERLNKKGIPVCIIYGNHDPLGSTADLYKLPPNVKVFPWENSECLIITNSNGIPLARVFGQSYRNAAENRKMYATFAPPDSTIPNIGMLHTALNPGAKNYIPCSLEDLRKVPNLHYWALGHIHHPCLYSSEIPVVAYPGIPQGRDPGEPGMGGCLLVEADIDRPAQVQFLPLSEIVWLNLEIPIKEEEPGDLDSLEELLVTKGQEIIAEGPERFYPAIDTVAGASCPVKGYIARWEITGRGKLHEVIADQEQEELTETLENRLRQSLGTGSPFLWTEAVAFKTAAPLPDINTLAEQDFIFRTLIQQRSENQQAFKDKNQQALKKEMVAALGSIWYEQKDAEDLREDSIPLTEEKLEELLDRAQALVFDRIIREREGIDY